MPTLGFDPSNQTFLNSTNQEGVPSFVFDNQTTFFKQDHTLSNHVPCRSHAIISVLPSSQLRKYHFPFA